MEKRTAKSIASAQDAKQPSKKKKLPKNSERKRDFSKYFPQSSNTVKTKEKNSPVKEKSHCHQNPTTVDEKASQTDRNEPLSSKELTTVVSEMTAISQVLVKQLQSACKALHLHRTKSMLGVRDDRVIEEEAPLLTLFKKYNLPLKTKEEVELLETDLKDSHDFLKFFVSLKSLQFCSFHHIKNTA